MNHHSKQRRGRKSAGWTTGTVAVAGFIMVWCFFLLYAHSSLHDERANDHPSVHHTDIQPLTKEVEASSQRKVVSTTKVGSSNPYYGWQPAIASEMTCPWRTCFEKDHSCSTCRDLPQDMGPPPPAAAHPDAWIPDVTMLHRMLSEGKDSRGNPWPPPPLSSDKELCEPIGVFGGRNDDNKKLFDQVPIAVQLPSAATKEPTIFCGIYTIQASHATNIRAMRETWAPQCNGFLAFSTETDARIPAISVPHDGPEEYNNMWQKVRSIWRFIGQHYLEDFDYFILGGEDLFIIPPNLRKYLQTLGSPEDDHFAGRRFKGGGPNNYFNSGGSGYVLSRGTLRKFFEIGLDHPRCNPNRHTPMEDVMTAECLRNAFSIGLTDTRDEEGRERFHPFSPGSHLQWTPPKAGKRDWYEDYNMEWGIKLGTACCAPDSVSFHYIKKTATVRHLYSLLYHCKAEP